VLSQKHNFTANKFENIKLKPEQKLGIPLFSLANTFGVEHVTFHASIPLKMTTTMVLTISSDHRFKHQMLQWLKPSLLFAVPWTATSKTDDWWSFDSR